MFKFIDKISVIAKDIKDLVVKVGTVIEFIHEAIPGVNTNMGLVNEKFNRLENTLDNIVIRLSSNTEEIKMNKDSENTVKKAIKDNLLAEMSKKGNNLSKQEVIALINSIKTED